jgi:hypothetical protein
MMYVPSVSVTKLDLMKMTEITKLAIFDRQMTPDGKK